MPSMQLNAQEIELLSALNDCKARYLIIGGHAVIFHGHLRQAKDLDIWIEPTKENAQRVARALSTVRIFLQPEHVERLAALNLKMPIAHLCTELLTSVTGLEFSDAMKRSKTIFENGTPCRVLGLEDLLLSKRALGRESDLADIAQLESKSRA